MTIRRRFELFGRKKKTNQDMQDIQDVTKLVRGEEITVSIEDSPEVTPIMQFKAVSAEREVDPSDIQSETRDGFEIHPVSPERSERSVPKSSASPSETEIVVIPVSFRELDDSELDFHIEKIKTDLALALNEKFKRKGDFLRRLDRVCEV